MMVISVIVKSPVKSQQKNRTVKLVNLILRFSSLVRIDLLAPGASQGFPGRATAPGVRMEITQDARWAM